jgi:hypothetical protein
VHEVRRGAERALAEADATIDTLWRDVSRLEEENTAMVLQILELTRELQEARDSEAEACMLRRQRVQMFRGFSACLMEAAHRLGIDGLNLPTIPEDDGSILHFFIQLAEKLADALAKVAELIDAKCRELLGLAGTRIFSNIQRLRPDLDLEEVLQRRALPPQGTPDRTAQDRAARLDSALQRLQAIYACPRTSAAAGQESSSSGDATSSGESSSEEAEEASDDGVQRRGILEVQPRHRRRRGLRGRCPVSSPYRPSAEVSILAAHSVIVIHCPAGPFLSCNRT